MSMSPQFRKRLAVFGGLALVPVLLLAAVLIASRDQAGASSHREAPLISKDAFADNTDVYAFISPENQNNIVLIASYIPFEGPEGGPNYFEFDPNVRYRINVDTTGDAVADVIYELSSDVTVKNPNTFLYNTAPITPNLSGLNRQQTVTVKEQFLPGMGPAGKDLRTLVNNQPIAPVNIGSKSTADYGKLMEKSIFTFSDPDTNDQIKIFAGQTDDPFWVDLQVFDLLTLRGQNPPIGYSAGNNIPVDSLSGFNVHSLAIEVPISRIKYSDEPVFGVWADAMRKNVDLDGNGPGTFKQVSRLGMPLTNEAVLPMGLKDTFNSIRPDQDLGVYGVLQKSVEDPELGNLLCGLYKVPLPGDTNKDCATEFTGGTPRTGRGDIFDIFLTGMVLANDFTIQTKNGPVVLPKGSNVNQPRFGKTPGVVPAEMLRINTDLKGDTCSPTPHRLGVLGGDACGFPNGRRLTDDVVEIEILAVAGAAYEVLDDRDAGFSFDANLIGVLTDGIDANDKPFSNSFPYLAMPHSGQEHLHTNPFLGIYLPLLQAAANAADAVGGATPMTASAAVLALLAVPVVVWRRLRS